MFIKPNCRFKKKKNQKTPDSTDLSSVSACAFATNTEDRFSISRCGFRFELLPCENRSKSKRDINMRSVIEDENSQAPTTRYEDDEELYEVEGASEEVNSLSPSSPLSSPRYRNVYEDEEDIDDAETESENENYLPPLPLQYGNIYENEDIIEVEVESEEENSLSLSSPLSSPRCESIYEDEDEDVDTNEPETESENENYLQPSLPRYANIYGNEDTSEAEVESEKESSLSPSLPLSSPRYRDIYRDEEDTIEAEIESEKENYLPTSPPRYGNIYENEDTIEGEVVTEEENFMAPASSLPSPHYENNYRDEEDTNAAETESEKENDWPPSRPRYENIYENEDTIEAEVESEKENSTPPASPQYRSEEDSEEESESEKEESVSPQELPPSGTSIASCSSPSCSSSHVVFKDIEILDCPICVEPLFIPVFQCENGHIACSSCCQKLAHKCPSCSLPIGLTNRCRDIEKVLESVIVSCQNVRYGCQESIIYSEKREHEKNCLYAPFECPAFACSFIGSCGKLHQHLKAAHSSSVISFSDSHVRSIPFFFEKGDPCVILLRDKGGVIFILHHKVEDYGNAITLSCLQPLSSKNKYSYELTVKTDYGSSLAIRSFTVSTGSGLCWPASAEYVVVPSCFSSNQGVNLEIWITECSD